MITSVVTILLGIILIIQYKDVIFKDKVDNTILYIDKYNYSLTKNATKLEKTKFKELYEIIKENDTDKIVSSICENFIVEFFSLSSKYSINDIGGVQFVYEAAQDDFISRAKETYYRLVLSNDKQSVVSIEQPSIKNISFTLDNKTYQAYSVNIRWTNNIKDRQQVANVIIVYNQENNRYEIVEMT